MVIMEYNLVKLACPECGKEYKTYQEYFACWTSHLDSLIGNTGNRLSGKHEDVVRYYEHSPDKIETGLKILQSDIDLFRGLDLIGVDENHNLVLVSISREWKRKGKQLRRYKMGLTTIGKNIFGLGTIMQIRLLVVDPKEGTVRQITP
jgi:hypothetical protein